MKPKARRSGGDRRRTIDRRTLHEGGKARVVALHVVPRGDVAPARFQFGQRRRIGLPIALARGFDHAFDALRQRVRVVLFKPVGQAQRNETTDVGKALEDPANGCVIKMIVMIMGDDNRIKLMKLLDRQYGRRFALGSQERQRRSTS